MAFNYNKNVVNMYKHVCELLRTKMAFNDPHQLLWRFISVDFGDTFSIHAFSTTVCMCKVGLVNNELKTSYALVLVTSSSYMVCIYFSRS